MVNQHFRKDYWVRGARQLSVVEQLETLHRQRVVLAHHHNDVPLKISGMLGEVELKKEMYHPVLEFLADHQPKSIEQIEASMKQKDLIFSQVLQVLLVLSGAGYLHLVQEDKKAKAKTDKLNLHIMEKARASSDIINLASPVTGGGIPVPRFSQLFLLARHQGKKTSDQWAAFAWQILAAQNQCIMKEGKSLTTAEENLTELNDQAKLFESKTIPILKALGIA